ncbi:MAG: Holliday junction resolvase RuvX [Gammaproteobacteria bacterium]|nr:Holliday junction resolvase RuvX [Gammaproteobacteria bacterium]MBK79495.1 Holliday junction resolvase RuvX [Gammaproteobacteria bacterium]
MTARDSAAPLEPGYVLAFDFGLRYIGVATGQTVTGSAGPLTVLTARDGRPDWQDVLTLIREWQPVRLIVGLPLNMDGSDSDMAERARRFAAELARRSAVATVLADERLTTREARSRSAARGEPAGGDHALAAALIAETWLNEQR